MQNEKKIIERISEEANKRAEKLELMLNSNMNDIKQTINDEIKETSKKNALTNDATATMKKYTEQLEKTMFEMKEANNELQATKMAREKLDLLLKDFEEKREKANEEEKMKIDLEIEENRKKKEETAQKEKDAILKKKAAAWAGKEA